MIIVETFPENFKSLRKKFGYTQSDVAEKLGVKTQTIFKYEKGISFPPGDKLQGILELFKVSPNELFRTENGTTLDKLEERVKVHVEFMHKSKYLNLSRDLAEAFDTIPDYIDFMDCKYVIDVEKLMGDYFAEQLEIRREFDPLTKKQEHFDAMELEELSYVMETNIDESNRNI